MPVSLEVELTQQFSFSKNDVIANLGVIGAGFLVSLTGAAWPDLVVGLLVAAIVLRGGGMILRDRDTD